MQTILLAAVLGAALAADTVVVCPTPFLSAFNPWVQHRRAQGHNIIIVPTSRDVTAVHDRIRQVAQDGRVRTIVLIGDAPPITERFDNEKPDDKPLDVREPRTVPTHYVPAKINVSWGSEPEIATDNPYADFDGDRLPDAAIGRLTADTPDELSVIVQKIIDYENCRNFGPWRRRLNFVAGVGGFGAMADKAIEVGVKALITRGVPTPYATTMTYGSWRSPYCPDPKDFHGHLVDRLNEGCLYWVYIGHGHVRQLDRLRVPGGEHHIFDLHDVTKLACREELPIAFFMACYTGAFDASADCLAEEMLRHPGAPVAVIAGSRVTMPYGMAVLGMELLDAHFQDQRTTSEAMTLGDVFLRAKRRMAGNGVAGNGVNNEYRPALDEYRPAIDLLANVLSPVKSDLAGERLEHLQLFNLLGDPLLRIARPRRLEVRSASSVRAGELLEIDGQCLVNGRSPVNGLATIELTIRRDRLRFRPPIRSTYSSASDATAQYDDVYRQANDSCYVRVQTTVRDGRFEAMLKVPPDAWGECQVRVFVEGSDEFAMGSAEVEVVRPEAVASTKEPSGVETARRAVTTTKSVSPR